MPDEAEARAAAARINTLLIELWRVSEGEGPQYDDFELSAQQHAVLERIANNPEITSGELAADLGVTKGAISQHLGVLEAGGYIARRRSERDGRVQVLELQNRGRKYRDALVSYEDFLVDRYLERLSADDLTEIAAALSKLKGAFTSD
ncbi:MULTISPECIES: MarR family transcriptional regulator [unclassified Brevibacterium]|uniref:MarR family winged helix-turn-helix transcriptional regulator n=1 Tax=unclassified Brevibacterium TaxID=2614124 RepID=UPI0010F674C4|nr:MULTISPECIES: MarR family transcriptional regulator [unclassified Brevibacterium]MCM1011947.1 MarR family transcriptional regulator [Brevibacterium sp. XM4083]